MRTEQGPPPTRRAAATGRAEWRAGQRGRRRWPFLLVVVVLVAGSAAAWWYLGRPTDGDPTRGVSPEGGTELLVFAVTGQERAFVAVVGAGGDHEPTAAIVPWRLVVEIPGAGGGTVAQAARLPATMLQLTVANLLATEVHHVAVFDLQGLEELVDGTGGITLDIAGKLEVGGRTLGPGPTDVPGSVAAAYLADALPFERDDRFAAVLDALLDVPDLRVADDVAFDTDDVGGVERVLRAASGAAVEDLPSLEAGGNLVRPDFEAMPSFLSGAFGLGEREVIELLVLNGNGRPGMGEAVARRTVAAGFRVVASDNLQSFDFPETEIRVDPGFEDAGERVRALLGLGKVIVSEQGSGLAPVTVVVGQDFVEA